MNNDKPQFLNPWPGAGGANDAKVTAYVPRSVLDELKSKRLIHGTQTITINLLIKKLLDECQRRGFDTFRTTEAFEQFVLNSRLTLPGEYVTADGKYLVSDSIPTIPGGQSLPSPLPNGGGVASPPRGPTAPHDGQAVLRNDGSGSTGQHSEVGEQTTSGPDNAGRSSGRGRTGRGKAGKGQG